MAKTVTSIRMEQETLDTLQEKGFFIKGSNKSHVSKIANDLFRKLINIMDKCSFDEIVNGEYNVVKKVSPKKKEYDEDVHKALKFFNHKYKEILGDDKRLHESNDLNTINLILNFDKRDKKEFANLIIFAATQTKMHWEGEDYCFCVLSPKTLRDKYERLRSRLLNLQNKTEEEPNRIKYQEI